MITPPRPPDRTAAPRPDPPPQFMIQATSPPVVHLISIVKHYYMECYLIGILDVVSCHLALLLIFC